VLFALILTREAAAAAAAAAAAVSACGAVAEEGACGLGGWPGSAEHLPRTSHRRRRQPWMLLIMYSETRQHATFSPPHTCQPTHVLLVLERGLAGFFCGGKHELY
jgi:hypothetical protein